MATTKELKRWAGQGALIVTIGECKPVIWQPARPGDRRSWIDLYTAERYRPAELKAVTPNGGGPWSVACLLRSR